MPIELEAAAADTLAASAAASHAPAPGALCANCGAPLHGPWCHACGQAADNHKRSILHLSWEMVEGLLHLDGRLLRTAPDLFFRPGRLARDYMEGRVARHVPPFRTFLVALLLFVFAAEHAIHQFTLANERQQQQHAAALATPAGRAAEAARLRGKAADDLAEALKEARNDRAEDLSDKDEDRARVEATYAKAAAAAQADYVRDLADADRAAQGLPHPPRADVGVDLTAARARGGHSLWHDGLKKAIANPEYFLSVMFAWGHRLAVLLLPIVGLTLALVYRNKPRFFIYDHMLVAMNLLSFAFLTNALGLILPARIMGPYLGLVALWLPVNLFQTLRGAYGSGVVGAALKTLIVWLTVVVWFSILVIALMVLTLAQL